MRQMSGAQRPTFMHSSPATVAASWWLIDATAMAANIILSH